jgi:hypothetical protein
MIFRRNCNRLHSAVPPKKALLTVKHKAVKAAFLADIFHQANGL